MTSGEIIDMLERAITDQRLLEMEYADRDGNATCRIVKPLVLEGTRLTAHCHMRGGLRAFSTLRIRSLSDVAVRGRSDADVIDLKLPSVMSFDFVEVRVRKIPRQLTDQPTLYSVHGGVCEYADGWMSIDGAWSAADTAQLMEQMVECAASETEVVLRPAAFTNQRYSFVVEPGVGAMVDGQRCVRFVDSSVPATC